MVSVATAPSTLRCQCAYRVGSVANDTAGSSVVATFSAVSSANATYLRERAIRDPLWRSIRASPQLRPLPRPTWGVAEMPHSTRLFMAPPALHHQAGPRRDRLLPLQFMNGLHSLECSCKQTT